MARFDLSNAADFSRLTQQTIGDLVSLFGGRNPNEWDIVEASYNGVLFHVFQSKTDYSAALPRVIDTRGRRKVKYKFPYRDGQTTDDLGRDGATFQMEAIIHGRNYLAAYQKLIAEFDKPTPGRLVHPVFGEIKCAVEDWVVTHQVEQRKALSIRINFIEHNFTIGSVRELRDSSVKGALTAALAIFKKIDAALAAIEGAQLLARGLKNRLASLLNTFKTTNGKVLTNLNVTFNTRGGSADIPSLLPTNLGGTRNSEGTVIDDTFIVLRSVNDPFNGVPVEEIENPTLLALAVADVTNQVANLRIELDQILQEINDSPAVLELFDTTVELRETAILMQDVLEKGIASSNAQIRDYRVPRLMSIREIAFANGISPNRMQEIDLLNPNLLSVNYIPKDTVVKVPVA